MQLVAFLWRQIAVVGRSESFKVMDFDSNGKPVCDFLLLRNSNCDSVSPLKIRRRIYWKLPTYCMPVSFDAPLGRYRMTMRCGWSLAVIKLPSLSYIFVATALAGYATVMMMMMMSDLTLPLGALDDTRVILIWRCTWCLSTLSLCQVSFPYTGWILLYTCWRRKTATTRWWWRNRPHHSLLSTTVLIVISPTVHSDRPTGVPAAPTDDNGNEM